MYLGNKVATSKSSKPISLKKQMKAAKAQPMDNEFGRWERYSSGFGTKMLEKMGWKHGKGLGSEGEGIVNPVKATSHKEFGKGLAHMQIKKVSRSLIFACGDSHSAVHFYR